MRRYFLIIFSLSLMLFISCAKKESNITVKVGVVMNSGDIKNVARQEFLITHTDVVFFWKESKKMIEKEIGAELDYENKMNNFEKEKNKYESIVAQKTARNNPQLSKMVDDLKANINKRRKIIGRTRVSFSDIEILEMKKTNYNEIKEIINKNDQIYKNYIKAFKSIESLYEEFKKIKISISNLGEEERNNIYKITQGISELKKDRDLKVRKKTIEQFQLKLKENLVQTFKTNLNGEASFTLEKKNYYIFGLVTVGINNIIWSLPLDVTEDTQYLELSNDNAYALSDESLFEELSEAIMGIGTVE